ncbi:MAG: response regulator transcription factor [Propionicimonas sp.]
MATTHSVLLAEDDPRMRRALLRIVDQYEEFVVVGEVADGKQAIESCTELRPDVVLMDIEMPRMTGIEATRQIVRLVPETKVVALTAHPTASHVLPMIRAGASGYILKDFSRTELREAMLAVLGEDGRFAISPALVRLLAECATDDLRDGSIKVVLPAGSVDLTGRERELVGWLARGLSNRAIAQRMFLSEGSVKTYLSHITTKLGVNDRVQALIRCYELGLVNPSLSLDDLSAR